MGFIGSLIGTDSGNTGGAGLNYKAEGLGTAESNQAQQQSQAALAQQQAFVNALNAQNGLSNQSQVYNQMQAMAAGQGPNPAQEQFKQNINQANQMAAGQIASTKGINPALAARMGAQVGAQNSQAAAGQAATLQAQQQQNAIYGAGSIANQQVANQMAGVQGLNQFSQGAQQNVLGSLESQNRANAGVSQVAAGGQSKFGYDTINSAGKGIMMAAHGGAVHGYADGGMAPANEVAAPMQPSGPRSNLGNFLSQQLSGSSMSAPAAPQQDSDKSGGLGAGAGKQIKSLFSSPEAGIGGGGEAAGAGVTSASASPAMLMMAAAHGGRVPAVVSPGERYLPPKEVEKVAKGEKSPASAGEKIPGKAKVKGDSYKNDTVPKTLEEGGIVIPRSVMESKDPHKEAAKFVAAVLAKQGIKAKRK